MKYIKAEFENGVIGYRKIEERMMIVPTNHDSISVFVFQEGDGMTILEDAHTLAKDFSHFLNADIAVFPVKALDSLDVNETAQIMTALDSKDEPS